MRVKFDTAEVDDPGQPGVVVNDYFFRCTSGGERERNRSQPVGALLRRAFLIEGFALGAIDETLQNDWTVSDAVERSGRNRKIIAHEVELRKPDLLGEVRFPGMGDANLAPIDFQYFGRIFCRFAHSQQRTLPGLPIARTPMG